MHGAHILLSYPINLMTQIYECYMVRTAITSALQRYKNIQCGTIRSWCSHADMT